MDSKIMDRLRKMVAHEKSARAIGSIAEAEAFAAKIQQVMDEHNLGMTDVEFAQRDAEEPIGWTYVGKADEGFRHERTRKAWQTHLAMAIADVNNCRVILSGGCGNNISFVGRTSNREFAKMMFIYFLDLSFDLNEKAAELARGEQKFHYVNGLRPWQDYDINEFYKIMRGWKDAWFVGFSHSLSSRLYAKAKESRAAAQQTEVGNNAIVHIQADKLAINDFLKGKTRKSRSSGRENMRNAAGYEQGKRQGSAVNLTPHTFGGGRASNERLLGA